MRRMEILLIEDEPQWISLLTRMYEEVFEEYQPNITVAKTLNEAHKFIQKGPWDVASVDLNLGGCFLGEDALRHLAEQDRALYVLCISGIVNDDNGDESRPLAMSIVPLLNEIFGSGRSTFIPKLPALEEKELFELLKAVIEQRKDDIELATGRRGLIRVLPSRRMWSICYRSQEAFIMQGKPISKKSEEKQRPDTKLGMPGVEWLCYVLTHPLEGDRNYHDVKDIVDSCAPSPVASDTSDGDDDYEENVYDDIINRNFASGEDAELVSFDQQSRSKNIQKWGAQKQIAAVLGFTNNDRQNWQRAKNQLEEWKKTTNIEENMLREILRRVYAVDNLVQEKREQLASAVYPPSEYSDEKSGSTSLFQKHDRSMENLGNHHQPQPGPTQTRRSALEIATVSFEILDLWLGVWAKLQQDLYPEERRQRNIDLKTVLEYVRRCLGERGNNGIKQYFPEVYKVLRGKHDLGSDMKVSAFRFPNDNADKGYCYDADLSGVRWEWEIVDEPR